MKLAVTGESKVTLQGCVLRVAFSQDPFLSLLQPGRDTGSHMVATAAGGRSCGLLVGTGYLLPVSGLLGDLPWLLIQPGRDLNDLGAD